MSNFYTVGDVRLDMDSNLHAGGVSGLQDFYKTLDKGRRAMIGKIRPEELIRKTPLSQAFYPKVDRYAAPDDLKYDDVIELALLSGYRNVDTMNSPLMSVNRRRFGQMRGGARNVMNIGYENGVKYIRLANPNNLPNRNSLNCRYQTIDNCDSLSSNGTWNVGGNVVNLRQDSLNHVIGFASFRFDINDSSTEGFLENFTLNPFDLSTFLQKGAAFAFLNLTNQENLLAVKITLGSASPDLSTNYYTATVNQPHDSNQFSTGWNLLAWMLNDLTVVGTPNPAALNYVRFDFTTTGSPIPNCNIDNITARLGAVYEVTYNSSYIFMDPLTSVFKKEPTSDADLIVAEEDTYEIFLKESTLAAQRELYGSGIAAQSDVDDIQSDLAPMYQAYKMNHKSDALILQDDIFVNGNFYDGYSDEGLPGSAADGANYGGAFGWWN